MNPRRSLGRLVRVWSERLRRGPLRITPQPLPFLAAFGVVVALTFTQYVRFGTGMLLGWDPPYYVYLTTLVEDRGLLPMISEWNYPHLYVVSLWAIGKAIGDFTLAERLFPIFWLAVLLLVYQRISWNLTHVPFVSSMTVVLAAVAINTIRIYADLHRGLMALALSYVLLIEVSNRTTPLLHDKRSSVLVCLLLLGIAATHIETYAVLAVALVASTAFRRDVHRAAEYILFCSLPLVILSPVLLPLFVEYPSRIDVLLLGELVIDPTTVLLFAAGSAVTLPFAVLGGLYLLEQARKGNRLAELLFAWTTTLLALFVMLATGLVRLPAVRVLYLVPVPVLLALSLPWIGDLARKRQLASRTAAT